jgi:hypothetical protein
VARRSVGVGVVGVGVFERAGICRSVCAWLFCGAAVVVVVVMVMVMMMVCARTRLGVGL